MQIKRNKLNSLSIIFISTLLCLFLSGCSHEISGDYVLKPTGNERIYFFNGDYTIYNSDNSLNGYGTYYWDEEEKCYFLVNEKMCRWDVVMLEPQLDGSLRMNMFIIGSDNPSYSDFVKEGAIWTSPLMIITYCVALGLLVLCAILIVFVFRKKKNKNKTIKTNIYSNDADKSFLCSKCGSKYELDQKYCKKCGNKLI